MHGWHAVECSYVLNFWGSGDLLEACNVSFSLYNIILACRIGGNMCSTITVYMMYAYNSSFSVFYRIYEYS